MINKAVIAMVRAYRADPVRPHCNRIGGVHAWTCRLAVWLGILPDWCGDVPGPIPD